MSSETAIPGRVAQCLYDTRCTALSLSPVASFVTDNLPAINIDSVDDKLTGSLAVRPRCQMQYPQSY